METTLTEAELEAGLRDALERVRGGERVVVERDGQAIAVIGPPPKPGITWAELVDALRDVPPLDDDFAQDIADIRATQRPMRVPEWPD